ncbi:MAG: adenylate kinase [Candidatus Bathyarchaeota archaeon]|nr:adenylate kinase [Candidatus Bathyarchaeota archaeon]
MRIVMLGPPGSGKGTQARIISDIYGIPVITTGDMLREAVAEGTEYGKVAKEYMNRGDLVPDDIVNGIVRQRFSQPGIEEGFILDGYPRSTSQADALDEILEENNQKLDYIIHIVLGDKTIIDRLSKRRSCPNCGAIYHLESKPPKKKGYCDQCGSGLIRREDDNPDVIKNRLEVYREKTRPLLERYKDRGLIKEVPGDVKLDELPDIIKKLLG